MKYLIGASLLDEDEPINSLGVYNKKAPCQRAGSFFYSYEKIKSW